MRTHEKQTYCHTCKRALHRLGVARHRAMHRDRKEDCVISFSGGDLRHYHFSGAAHEN